jgi:hypothetical protein
MQLHKERQVVRHRLELTHYCLELSDPTDDFDLARLCKFPVNPRTAEQGGYM